MAMSLRKDEKQDAEFMELVRYLVILENADRNQEHTHVHLEVLST